MTRFLDGPAAGIVLALRSAPLFLRAVKTQYRSPINRVCFRWDALDQPLDRPEPDEELFAYRRCYLGGKVHIRARKGSGWFPLAEYRLVEQQPEDAVMRSPSAWAQWCSTQAALLGPTP